MNTRNTSSAWTKTAWCTPQNLWSNLAPTLCGRSSVCGCIALSAAGPTHGSSGRSQTYITYNITSSLSFSVLLTSCSMQIPGLYYFHLDSLSSFSSSFCFSWSVVLHVFHLPPQGTKTMWQLTLLPTLANISLRADTTCTHWRLTGKCSFIV